MLLGSELVLGRGLHEVQTAGFPVVRLAPRMDEFEAEVSQCQRAHDGKDYDTVYAQERGFQVARWARSGMNHWVISDLGRTEFAKVVGALETVDAAK